MRLAPKLGSSERARENASQHRSTWLFERAHQGLRLSFRNLVKRRLRFPRRTLRKDSLPARWPPAAPRARFVRDSRTVRTRRNTPRRRHAPHARAVPRPATNRDRSYRQASRFAANPSGSSYSMTLPYPPSPMSGRCSASRSEKGEAYETNACIDVSRIFDETPLERGSVLVRQSSDCLFAMVCQRRATTTSYPYLAAAGCAAQGIIVTPGGNKNCGARE